jgi:hypothetical protein
MKHLRPLLSFALVVLIAINASAQVGHVTCSLQNCSNPNAHTIEFDLYVVNDGVTSLKLNSVSFGINLNDEILQSSNDALVWSWNGQSDLPAAITGTFAFSYSSSLQQLKFTSLPGAIVASSAPVLSFNVPVKVGHFTVTNTTESWAPNSTTNFQLSTAVVGGSTNTGVVAYQGEGIISMSMNNTITRDVSVACSIKLNHKGSSSDPVTTTFDFFSLNNAVNSSQKGGVNTEPVFNLYPNPSDGYFVVDLSGVVTTAAANEEEIAVLEIVNPLGQVVVHERVPIAEGSMLKEIHLGDDVAAGTYLVKVMVNEQLFMKQVVCQR